MRTWFLQYAVKYLGQLFALNFTSAYILNLSTFNCVMRIIWNLIHMYMPFGLRL